MTSFDNENTPEFPRHSKGKRPKFFEREGVDESMSMILVLASEFCAMRDRMDTIEKIAEQKGILLNEEIENFKPKAEDAAARDQRRVEFLKRLYYVTLKQAEEEKAKDSTEKYNRTIKDLAEG